MIKDAVYSAERVYYKLNDLYGYPIHKSVERVQGAGESGKKEVADNKRKQYRMTAYSFAVKIYFLLFIKDFLEKNLNETSLVLRV